MKHASATCETCVYGMCLQHLLETYAHTFVICVQVCMLDAHAW
jgi:hypothetical protein